jgi:hypothetical protein
MYSKVITGTFQTTFMPKVSREQRSQLTGKSFIRRPNAAKAKFESWLRTAKTLRNHDEFWRHFLQHFFFEFLTKRIVKM